MAKQKHFNIHINNDKIVKIDTQTNIKITEIINKEIQVKKIIK